MAVPNSTYTEIVTTTLEQRNRKLADNVLTNNVVLRELSKRGNVRTVSGGHVILEEIAYQGATATWFSGYEVLNLTPTDMFTSAQFDPKQLHAAVTISGLEMAQNRGREQMIDLLESRIEYANKSMQNSLAAGVFADGTGSGGKELGGLQSLVADAPTSGTVGGIDRSAQSFWQNYTSGDLTTPSASNIQASMQTAWINVVRGSDHPNLIVADATFFGYYWSALTEIQRIMKVDEGTAGYESLMFAGPGGAAPVYFDSNCPSNHMYMLNLDYLKFRPYAGQFFKVSDRIQSINQDAVVVHQTFTGNMTASNCDLQAVLYT